MPTGLQFGGAETKPIGLVTPAGETPEDNAAQREFYAEIKDKAGALIRGIIRDLPAQETLTTILNFILRVAS